MAGDPLNTKAYKDMRRELRMEWSAAGIACWICGQAIDWAADAYTPDAFELDHIKPRKTHPQLALDRSNAAPSHHRCNRGRGPGDPRPPLGMTSEAW